MMLDEVGDDPFEIGCARSTLGVLFEVLIHERRRIGKLADLARDRNDSRLDRVEACGRIVDDRLAIWLDRWQAPEPPN
jgi:hypothetical protein